jgi:DNA-binding HxlR family transcriptional regulator
MKIDNKEVLIQIGEDSFHCAMDITMHFVGGKWKTVVLWYFKNEKRRFTEINKLIPQMTERMLSITLKQLEEDGLILREVYTTKPPLKVEYSLTEFGKTLIPVLNSIAKWGREVGEKKGKLITKD